MTIASMQQKARAEWDKLYRGDIPHILIGTATCGRAAGALAVVDAFNKELARRQAKAHVSEVGCIGLCSLEPLVTIIKPDSFTVCYHNISPSDVPALVEGYIEGDDPCLDLAVGTVEGGGGEAVYIPELERFEHEHRVLLRNCGYNNPREIDHYLACGGYNGLARALSMSREDILNEIERSGLRGRGGAGFPTGTKWRICRQTGGTARYVICNADEGDPGAFMDRVVLESDPQQLLEGMVIAGYAVDARQGYIYIRSEYPLAVEILRCALTKAREKKLLGKDIMGSGFAFDIEIIEGAGAFVCGEETALIASLEGKRGMPQPRPPFPAVSGLWGDPTAIDNVKTFVYVPLILERGADWFAGIGTAGSKGTAVFAFAGSTVNTGLAEVAMGTTLHELIYDIGGGIKKERKLKGVQIGGPSGGCLPQSMMQTPVDFDSLKKAGAIMGSGGIITMDEGNCMVDTAKFMIDFNQKESCGKCTLCRIGTIHMLNILERITAGQGRIEDIDLLVALGEDIKLGSLCGLGRTAPNPVLTTIRYFRDEYEAHILEKRCPALVCKELIAYYILPEKCQKGCDHCVLSCPVEAISTASSGIKIIDQSKCSKCGNCEAVCPPEYDAVIRMSPVELVPVTGPAADVEAKEAKE